MSQRDRALEQLSSEFPGLSARIIVSVFIRYLDQCDNLAEAVAATRERIRDACLV